MFHTIATTLLALSLSLPNLLGQETINNASLSGGVTDPSGAIVRFASVTARQSSTNRSRILHTDAEGRFRFPYLEIGQYELTIHQSGFADARTTITRTIGATFDLPVRLTVGSSSDTVNVDASTALLETERSQVAVTINQTEVANLPFNGRNFLDLALIAPGVSPTNTASSQLFAETSAVGGQGISVSSQRNFSNSFIVDGLSANDDAAGLVQAGFGMDVIHEMQVVTSGGHAEFGRALGGYINFVSKSGSNALHGDLYGYLRNQRLNTANALSRTNLPLTQAQYGASLSGPMLRNRTFYFGNFEQRNLNQNGVITINAANAAVINSVLQSSGYKGPQLAISSTTPTTIYSNHVRSSNFFLKLDHRVSDRDQLTARYSLYHVASQNSRGAGGLNFTSAAAGLEDLDQTVAFSNIATLTPRTLNETRAQSTNSDLNAPANDATGPAVSISGIASFGTLSGSPVGRHDRLYEVVDNLSHQAGSHALRIGADLLYNDLTITFPQSIRGAYAFSSLANFQRGIYTTLLSPSATMSYRSTTPASAFTCRTSGSWLPGSRSTQVSATISSSSRTSPLTPTTSLPASALPGLHFAIAPPSSVVPSASSTTAYPSACSPTRSSPTATTPPSPTPPSPPSPSTSDRPEHRSSLTSPPATPPPPCHPIFASTSPP